MNEAFKIVSFSRVKSSSELSKRIIFNFKLKESGETKKLEYIFFKRSDEGFAVVPKDSAISDTFFQNLHVEKSTFVIEGVKFLPLKNNIPVIFDDAALKYQVHSDGTLVQEISDKNVDDELNIEVAQRSNFQTILVLY